MFDVLPATVGHCVKLRTHLCMTFSAEPRTKPCARYFLLFFQHASICKSRQFVIVDRPRLQFCPRSECGVSEYVLG